MQKMMDKLMEDKEFCEKFDKEYQNLCIAEKIATQKYPLNNIVFIKIVIQNKIKH